MIEHSNLFLYESVSALEEEYPEGKVENPEPGVAYGRGTNGGKYSVYYNKKVTNYTLTVHSKTKRDETVSEDYVFESPNVFEENTVKVTVPAMDVDGYKPSTPYKKLTLSGDGEELTFIYLAETSYTITVNHMFSGESIACATTIVVSGIYEDDIVRVLIEPLEIEGYVASAVTIEVSGDTTYDLEYEEAALYEAVDLGLPSGTKWANMNLGAESPEGYGVYYAWGEIEPNKASAYTPQNYRFYPGNDDDECTKYNDTDNKMVLDLEDDAANVVMGGDWHMPTSAQCAELLDNTTSSWTTDYNRTGVAGMLFTSNNNGNSIFFPAAGIVVGGGSVGQGEGFGVWSSSRGSNSWRAWGVYGSSRGCDLYDGRGRCDGLSVRGVLGVGPGPIDDVVR